MADLEIVPPRDPADLAGRQVLPEAYLGLPDRDMDDRISRAKAALGRRLLILGHHYQRDEVVKFADFVGDSLRLSQQAATRPEAEFIVFCGVHFMAESADILCAPHQQVILPDLTAGCSMADMAAPEQVEACWQELVAAGLDDTVPVTYINSAASIKAFCGERGGLVCTSSNAAAALEWAWGRAKRVLFLPDEHLGRNTAWKMGVPLEEMVVWEPDEPGGGLAAGDAARSRLVLWAGNCSVHMRFTVQQIGQLRTRQPGVRIIVHPECTWDVVQAADDSGSTEYIVRRVTASPEGSVWGVGTETHLVQRLARALRPARTVMSLEPFGCLCSTMFRISPNHLLWILEELVAGRVHNRITVAPPAKALALAALNRMLALA